jgi:Condensation domain
MSELSKLIANLSPEQLELLHQRLNKLNTKKENISQPKIISQKQVSKSPPLSFAQQRLWFLDQLEPNTAIYNIPTAVNLKGLLNVTALEKSLNEIVRRHEALRTRFADVEGKSLQIIVPTLTLRLQIINLQYFPENQQQTEVIKLSNIEAQQPFDLTQCPLLRTTLLKVGEEEHVLLLTIHHIVADRWSIGVFVSELVALYEAFSTEKTSRLSELPIQYADFVYWQNEWLQGEVLNN